jgi:hypothetical protein
MTCLKWLRLLNVPLIESCIVFIIWEHIIVVFSFDALFGLTWHMLIPCLTLISRLKPLWSFVFWLVIPLYALVNNVLTLCMIMAVIALLVGRSQSFASLHLYWEGILLVHPTSKNRSFPKSPWCLVSTAHWEPQEEGMMSTAASLPSVVKPRFIKLVGENHTSEGDAC